MKICISGAQGVGKTSLLNEIKKKAEETGFLNNFEFKSEIVRDLIKKGVSINKEGDHLSQMLILETHYKNCLNNEWLLTDRCAVDAFVYATYNYLAGNFSLKEHLEQESLFLKCLPHYNVFFYIPIEFPLQKDGVRDTDVLYQKKIDSLFRQIYLSYKITPIKLTGSVEERYNKIRVYPFLEYVKKQTVYNK